MPKYMFALMITWLIGSLKKSQYIHINSKMEMLKSQELHFTNTNTQSGNLQWIPGVLAGICETFCPAQALCHHCSHF